MWDDKGVNCSKGGYTAVVVMKSHFDMSLSRLWLHAITNSWLFATHCLPQSKPSYCFIHPCASPLQQRARRRNCPSNHWRHAPTALAVALAVALEAARPAARPAARLAGGGRPDRPTLAGRRAPTAAAYPAGHPAAYPAGLPAAYLAGRRAGTCRGHL